MGELILMNVVELRVSVVAALHESAELTVIAPPLAPVPDPPLVLRVTLQRARSAVIVPALIVAVLDVLE